jgi:hypothetical protein
MTKASYAADTPANIPCASFNMDGSIYAYALSYDWNRGFQVCAVVRCACASLWRAVCC